MIHFSLFLVYLMFINVSHSNVNELLKPLIFVVAAVNLPQELCVGVAFDHFCH